MADRTELHNFYHWPSPAALCPMVNHGGGALLLQAEGGFTVNITCLGPLAVGGKG